jgi:hypothetical protein
MEEGEEEGEVKQEACEGRGSGAEEGGQEKAEGGGQEREEERGEDGQAPPNKKART